MSTRSAAMVAAYIHALMEHFPPASPGGRAIASWLRHNARGLGIDWDALMRAMRVRTPARSEMPLPARAWQALMRAMAQASIPGEYDAATENVDAFVHSLGLDAIESDLFRFVFQTHRDKSFNVLCGTIIDALRVDSLTLASLALRQPASELWSRLSRGPLRHLRLIDADKRGIEKFIYFVPDRIGDALLPPSNGGADIEARLIGTRLATALDSGDFAHMMRERDFAVRLLHGTLQVRQTGINILLHGAPGTGKTEFCKMVATAAGGCLFAVGEADENGEEPNRYERLEALRLAERLGSQRPGTVLLFDEMDDLLQGGGSAYIDGTWVRRAGSKLFLNRLLESNRVPILWAVNAIDEFDPALLRRMSFVFEMRSLPLPARRRLWEARTRERGLSLSGAQVAALARQYKVAPSFIATATDAVGLAKGSPDDLEFVVDTNSRPGRAAAPETPSAGRFEPALTNADSDLVRIERALTRRDAPRDVSLCCYGPPGTGKSAFARHLAAAMGLDVLVKRGSDLLSKWIGETEERIAAAFAEAKQDGRVLIIDEAESFLWSRAGAERSWEVSMVNELLVAMEKHTMPFICTTNHLDSIDKAALRRFSFKVKFDFMTPEQSRQAYERFFGRAAPAALKELAALTPGDLAVVAKKLWVLDSAHASDAEILEMLEHEVAVKNLPARRIGF
jgi:transitional endoplasmic reticulum ATPase